MSTQIKIDVQKAEQFCNEMRQFKQNYSANKQELHAALQSINQVWDDPQQKEFTQKLQKELRVLEDFSNQLDKIIKFVDTKIQVSKRKLI